MIRVSLTVYDLIQFKFYLVVKGSVGPLFDWSLFLLISDLDDHTGVDVFSHQLSGLSDVDGNLWDKNHQNLYRYIYFCLYPLKWSVVSVCYFYAFSLWLKFLVLFVPMLKYYTKRVLYMLSPGSSEVSPHCPGCEFSAWPCKSLIYCQQIMWYNGSSLTLKWHRTIEVK